MSDIKKTIEVLFSATDDMSGTMSSIGSKMSAFSDSVGSATQPLADITKSIAKLDVALGLMVAGGLALSIKAAGDFGDAFSEISTLIDDTGQDVNQFEKDILSYATNSTASIEDINKAIYTAISAGTNYKDSLDILTQTEKLSVAGKADLEATIRVLVSSLNAYGVSVDEAQAFSDALFTTVKVGQTTLPELANSLARVSTIAAQGGVSFDELMAAIAAVTATGAPTTLAISSIRAAIAAILKPSAEATKEAGRLGIAFDASALATRGLDGVLKDVYSATGGATDQITKLFGSVESLPAVLTLGADTSGRFADALDAMATKTGATETAFLKMAANMTLANQNLANNVRVVLISLGDNVLDEYGDLANSVSEVFKALGTSIEAGDFGPILAVIEGVMNDITGTFEGIADALPEALEGLDWTKLIASLEGLGGSIGDVFSDLFGDLDLTNAEDLEKVIQTIIDAIAGLVDVTSGIVQGLGPFIEMLGEMIEKFREMSPDDIAEVAGKILGLGTAVNVLSSIGSSLGGILSAIGGGLGTLYYAVSLLKTAGATSILTNLGGSLSFLKGLGVIGLGVTLAITGSEILYKLFPGLEDLDKKVTKWTFDFFIGDAAEQVGQWGEDLANLVADIIVGPKVEPIMDSGSMDGVEDWLEDHPVLFSVEPQMDSGAFDGIEDFMDSFDEFGPVISPKMDPDAFGDIEDYFEDLEETEIEVPVSADFEQAEKEGKEFWDKWDEEHEKYSNIPIGVDVDDESLEDTKKKIQQTFSEASITLPGFDIGEGVGPAYEINSEALGTATEALDSLGDLFAAADKASGLAASQREALAQQAAAASIALIQAIKRQITATTGLALEQQRMADIMKSSAEASEGGSIEIDCQNVEPALETVLFQILKKIQIRANESGAEFLLAAAS